MGDLQPCRLGDRPERLRERAIAERERQSVSATRDETGSALRLARASRDAGDFASAINLYRSVLAMKPGDGLTIELGDTLIQAGLYDDAIDVYGRIGKQSDAYSQPSLASRAQTGFPHPRPR